MSSQINTELRTAMEAFFQAYRAFTRKPDEILATLGLARVHHRILFFVANRPGMSVKELLAVLGVSKQAINVPLRQLVEMDLVDPRTDAQDKRVKRLQLTEEGARLESALHAQQLQLLETAFGHIDMAAVEGWLIVNRALQQLGQDESREKRAAEKNPPA